MDSEQHYTLTEYEKFNEMLNTAAMIIERAAYDLNDAWCEDHDQTVGYEPGDQIEKRANRITKEIMDLVHHTRLVIDKATRATAVEEE